MSQSSALDLAAAHRRRTTQFTDLYSDLLLEIFSYLTLNEILQAFDTLLPSLWTLISQGHVKIFIHPSISNSNFWTEMFPRISPKQLIALSIPYCKIDQIRWSEFQSLRSLTMENVTAEEKNVSTLINGLPSLKRMQVKLSKGVLWEKHWLEHLLRLPMLKKLQIDSMQARSTVIAQKSLSINDLTVRSLNVTCLEVRIPLRWRSLINLLHHFPRLKIFRAHLYPIEDHLDEIQTHFYLDCFQTLHTLDLSGYIRQMTLIIDHLCLPMIHLKSCRLMANNVLCDDLTTIVSSRDYFFGRRLIQTCSNLKSLKIHMLLPFQRPTDLEQEKWKERFRSFNNDRFSQEFNFFINQRSILNGYVTLNCDYQSKN